MEKTETESYIKVTHFESYSEKNPSYSEKNGSFSEEKHIKEKVKAKEQGALARVVELLENSIGTVSERIN